MAAEDAGEMEIWSEEERVVAGAQLLPAAYMFHKLVHRHSPKEDFVRNSAIPTEIIANFINLGVACFQRRCITRTHSRTPEDRRITVAVLFLLFFCLSFRVWASVSPSFSFRFCFSLWISRRLKHKGIRKSEQRRRVAHGWCRRGEQWESCIF